MIRFRAGVLIAVMAVPCALGASWLGCASGDEEVDGTPKRPPGSDTGNGGGDTGSGGGDTGTGGSDTGVVDTYKPLCTGEVGTPNMCTNPVDLGNIAVGSSKTVMEALPEKSGDLWYKVTFDTLDNAAAHPRITITSTDPAIVLEIVKSCAGETITCGDEDAFAVRIKDYEAVYRADPTAEGPYDAGSDTFIPLTVGENGTVYVRVFRTTGTPSACDFKLELSN